MDFNLDQTSNCMPSVGTWTNGKSTRHKQDFKIRSDRFILVGTSKKPYETIWFNPELPPAAEALFNRQRKRKGGRTVQSRASAGSQSFVRLPAEGGSFYTVGFKLIQN